MPLGLKHFRRSRDAPIGWKRTTHDYIDARVENRIQEVQFASRHPKPDRGGLLKFRTAGILLFLMGITFTAFAQTTILGALEELPGDYSGEPKFYGVRVLFEKDAKGWSAFRSQCPDQDCPKTTSSQFPSQSEWTLSFDGRKVGELKARSTKQFPFYEGLQQVTSKGPVPAVGRRSREFGGSGYALVHRPLVANSRPYFRDPESWKPAALGPDRAKLVRSEFRKKFPKVSNCASVEVEPKPWSYGDRDIKLIKTY